LKNILLTAAGSPVFIPTCKSLRSNPNLKDLIIHTCDMNSNAIGLKIADKFFIVPPGNSEEYIDVVHSYCKENKIDLIIPAADEELLVLSENANLFLDINCKILVSSPDSLKRVQNKSKLYFECSNSFVLPSLVPNHFVCNDLNSFKSSFKKIRSKHDKVCVKPASGHGSRGFRIIEDLPTKSDFFTKKPNSRSATFDFMCNILGQDENKIPDLLVMEYLPGEEYSVDIFCRDNKFYCITRRRDEIKEGICSAGAAIEKLDLIEISKFIYKQFDLKYSVNIQFKYDSNGHPKILEINPRLAGTMELSRGAGVDFVRLAVDEAFGFENSLDYNPAWGTKMQRVWLEVFSSNESLKVLDSFQCLLEEKFCSSGRFSDSGKQKVALIDIDETICFYSSDRKYDLAEPNFENIEKVNSLYNSGWKVVYWTARGSVSGRDYTEFTRSQLNSWGCKYHNLVTGTTKNPKPHFDLVIDDKSKRIEEL